MNENFLPRNKSLKQNSRDLRKNSTKQENHLWYDFLRYQEPRWTRQRIIGNYIVDFFCHSCKIAIELDGSGHFEDQQIEYDKKRTEYLEALGVKVIRFTNLEVDGSFNEVCDMIWHEANK